MRRAALIPLVLILAVILFPGSASAVLKLEGRYWFTDLNGEIKVTEGGITGTSIDIVDDLGMDDKENFWEGRVILELGGHKLRYGFMPLKWDGQKNIVSPITFKGQSFTAVVDSEVEVRYHRLGYEYDFVDTLENRIGVIIEVKYFDIDTSLKTAGLDESESIQAPIPTVGIAAGVGLPFLLDVGGEITGMTLGSYGYLIDGEIGVKFKPSPFVTISGGYRYFSFHVETDDDKVDLTVNGPFIMLRAGF